jgi:hypothetical protein
LAGRTRPARRAEGGDQGKERLKELHEKVQEYVGAFDLPGPREEALLWEGAPGGGELYQSRNA